MICKPGDLLRHSTECFRRKPACSYVIVVVLYGIAVFEGALFLLGARRPFCYGLDYGYMILEANG